MLLGRLCLVLIISGFLLRAQDRRVTPPPSPLAPSLQQYPSELLLTVAYGWGLQQGGFRGSCSEEFTRGTSSGWFVGLSYSVPLVREWLWGASLYFKRFRLRASYRAQELLFLQSSSDTFTVPATMRNRGELTQSTLLLWGYVRWRPTPWLVFSAGPTVALPLSATLHHTKEFLDPTLLLPTGETLYLPDAQLTVESVRLPHRFQWGAAAHAGADVLITSDWWLNFGLHCFFHLSALLPPPATVRLWQWYLSLALGKAHGRNL